MKPAVARWVLAILAAFVAAVCAQPPNDNFAKATRVSGTNLWLQEFNHGASVEAGEPHHLGASGPYGRSVWWTWAAPDHGVLRADLSRLPANTAVAVYSGSSVSNLTLLRSNASTFGPMEMRVLRGSRYFLAADNTSEVLLQIGQTLLPAPINDFFTNRLTLSGSTGAVVATSANASTEPGELPSGSSTIWWTWTAPVTSPLTIQPSDSTHVVEAYTNGTLASLRQLIGSEFASSGGRYTLGARAGGTYQLRVRPSVSAGPVSFIWYQAFVRVPQNDNLATRTLLTGTNTDVSGALEYASREPNEPAHGAGGGMASVWYGWRAPGNGTVRLTIASASFNVLAAFYRGTAYGSLTALANVRSDPFASTSAFGVNAGIDYAIAVESPFPTDTYTLRFDFTAAPTNDDFANRGFLAGDTVTAVGTTAGATKEPGEPGHAGSSSRTSTIWWTWQADANGPVTVTAKANSLDPVLAVYTGPELNALQPINSNNNYLPYNGDSRVTFFAVAGMAYHIAVATTPLAPGLINLDVREGGPPVVVWTQPASDLVLPPSANVDLELAVTPGGAAITNVVFDGLETDPVSRPAPPYTHSMTNLAYGTWALRGYAWDAADVIGVSDLRIIRVPPPHDVFSNRLVIPQETLTVTGTISGVARDFDEPSQLAGSTRVAWWSWTAPSNGTVYLQATNAGALTGSYGLSVYTGSSLGALTLVRSASSPPRLTFDALAGTEYQIAGESYQGGNFDISFLTPPFPPNDHFTNATAIVGTNETAFGNNTEATAEAGEPYHGGFPASKSAWWIWTAPGNGVLQLRTAGSTFDTRLSVYVGNGLTSVSRVADNRTSSFLGNSAVTVAVTNGVAYRIAVDGYLNASGDISLSLFYIQRPENDTFSQRYALSGRTNMVLANNSPATVETGEPTVFFGAKKTLWWSWTAPAAGRVIVSTEGSQVKNAIGVYTGNTVSGLALVKSAADLTSSNSVLEFDATMGTVYQIQLDSQNAAGGPLLFSVLQPNTAVNDLFADRLPLSGYISNMMGNNFNASREAGEPMHDTSLHKTVWWSWTATETRPVSIVPTSTTLPNVLAYSGSSLNGLSLLARNDSTGFPVGATTFNAVGGTTYQLAFFLPLGRMGEFAFSVVPNEPPAVTLLSPSLGATFYPGQPIIFDAVADDPDGTVSRILFAFGSASRVDSSAPYSAVFSNLALGDYSVYARAFDNLDAFATTPAMNIRVAPLNDLFTNAQTLAGADLDLEVDNTGAGYEEGEPPHAGGWGGRSLWFAWTAPTHGRFSITSSRVDTLLAVYVGDAVNALTLVASNDNRTEFEVSSEVAFAAESGRTYAIAVDGANGAVGRIALSLRRVAANDSYLSAVALAPQASVTANNFGATLEAEEPAGNDYAGGSVWWNWTAKQSGNFMATTAGSDFDTILSIYTGAAVSNLTLVASDDDGAANGCSLVRFAATSGETYRISVSGYGGARGSVRLTIATNGVPTLFFPALAGTNTFLFDALTEPGTTNVAQRSFNLSTWDSFTTNVALEWWTTFGEPMPGNTNRYYRVLRR